MATYAYTYTRSQGLTNSGQLRIAGRPEVTVFNGQSSDDPLVQAFIALNTWATSGTITVTAA